MQLTQYSYILLFILGGVVLVTVGLLISRIIRPNRPNVEKLSPYECGEEALGTPWGQFNVQYYIIALIFVLFEIEIVFLFPWATVFGQEDLIKGTNGVWGWFALVEVFIFVGILVIGLAYIWVKGYLDWIVPKPKIKKYNSKVPNDLYEQVNQKYEKAEY